MLDGDSTAPYLGDIEATLAAIDEFLASCVDAAPAGLSSREVEVLRLVAAGRSNRDIAEELTISLNTVDRHVSNILTKTGATNRAEAASFAVRNRLA
jgi:DNA-binding NarL/FixJ family response regulator